MKEQRYVIVGAGPAGLHAAEAIRSIDRRGNVILISDEPPYARMVLPYWLTGEVQREQLITGRRESFERIGVELREGISAIGLDPSAHRLMLSDGEHLAYDRLLLATGSSPALPQIPGIDLPGVHTFWRLSDVDRMLRPRAGTSEVLLLGAGFVGVIVAAAMLKLGWRVHIAEVLPRILPRMLDGQASALATSWLQKKGVEVLTGVRPTSVRVCASGRRLAEFENGESMEVDQVVVATGVRPRLELARSAGLAVDQGILVDDRMQTSGPDIFAAGDGAQGPGFMGGDPVVHALQPTATDHGRVAGANMAGQTVAYDGSLAMNLLDVAGLQCVSIGILEGEGLDAFAALEPARPMYRKLVWNGDALVGAILVGPRHELGRHNDVGMIKGMIQSGAGLGAWKRYLEVNSWDIRRAYTAARVAERLMDRALLPIPPKPRVHRYLGLEPEPAQRATHLQLMRDRPDHLEAPLSTPPLR